MSQLVPMPAIPILEDDICLEEANQAFWSALIRHIKLDHTRPIESVLDVGCHNGGLLARLAEEFHPKALLGVEPLSRPRERARFRLRHLKEEVTLISPDRWEKIPNKGIDLMTCHEVLHLVEDLDALFKQVSRTLRPNGTLFVVAGCHTENPVWPRWSGQLRTSGQIVFDRSPFDILNSGIQAGLKGALQPLRRDGWVFYDPNQAQFKYASVAELFAHHYQFKLIFRFVNLQ